MIDDIIAKWDANQHVGWAERGEAHAVTVTSNQDVGTALRALAHPTLAAYWEEMMSVAADNIENHKDTYMQL